MAEEGWTVQWRYLKRKTIEQSVNLPLGSWILSVQNVGNRVAIFYKIIDIATKNERTPVEFHVFQSGVVRPYEKATTYIGTVFVEDGIGIAQEYHVFMVQNDNVGFSR